MVYKKPDNFFQVFLYPPNPEHRIKSIWMYNNSLSDLNFYPKKLFSVPLLSVFYEPIFSKMVKHWL